MTDRKVTLQLNQNLDDILPLLCPSSQASRCVEIKIEYSSRRGDWKGMGRKGASLLVQDRYMNWGGVNKEGQTHIFMNITICVRLVGLRCAMMWWIWIPHGISTTSCLQPPSVLYHVTWCLGRSCALSFLAGRPFIESTVNRFMECVVESVSNIYSWKGARVVSVL